MSIIDWGTSQATMLPCIFIYTVNVNVNVHLQSLKQKIIYSYKVVW